MRRHDGAWIEADLITGCVSIPSRCYMSHFSSCHCNMFGTLTVQLAPSRRTAELPIVSNGNGQIAVKCPCCLKSQQLRVSKKHLNEGSVKAKARLHFDAHYIACLRKQPPPPVCTCLWLHPMSSLTLCVSRFLLQK